MNIVDEVICRVSPIHALKRETAKQKIDMLHKIRDSGYSEGGASRKKSYGIGWKASSKSPQDDIDKNLPLMRERSRNLFMTAPLATSAIRTNRTNVIGEGLRPRPKIDAELLGMNDEEAANWQRRTEREFSLWAEKKLCDKKRLNNFYEIQQLVMMSYLMNGDAFCLFDFEKPKYEKLMPYGLRVNLIESDRLCTPNYSGTNVDLNYRDKTTNNRVYSGVEIDKNGSVVAYHICSTYPTSSVGTTEKKWVRVEAFGRHTGLENALLIFDSERVEQYRGVPYLAPVIESIKQLTRYTEAELMSAVVSSFFTAFIKTKEDTSELPFIGNVSESDTVSSQEHTYEMGPGAINVLEPGESVDFADPNHPNQNFEKFVLSMAQYTGAALEVPVELLTKKFSSNYSASRAALLEAWKMFRMRRAWMVSDFCQPVYERWLTEAVSIGRVKAPGFFEDSLIRNAYCKCQWNGPAAGMIDPTKEVEAATMRISAGLSTREKESMELNGTDFYDNIRELGKENAEMKKQGLKQEDEKND